MKRCRRTRIHLLRAVLDNRPLTDAQQRHVDNCPSCHAYHAHLVRCWEVSNVHSELEPRPELRQRICSRVREMAAMEEERELRRGPVAAWVQRFMSPLSYAAIGSVLTAVLMFTLTGNRGNSGMGIPVAPAMVSVETAEPDAATAERPSIPTRMLGDIEYTAFVPPSVAPRRTDSEDSGLATGWETTSDAHLTSLIY